MNDIASQTMARELRTVLTSSGEIELSLQSVQPANPQAGEIVVRVEAAPVNPTDISLMMGPGKPSEASLKGEGSSRVLSIPLPPAAATALGKRKDLSICPGLEGAGIVVAAGEGAEYLVGKTAAIFGGGMYGTYRLAKADECLIFPEGTPPSKCASAFVNPMTALCIIDTMRREGHTALVHTAATSNLGQMLVRLCQEDGIPLVNIVRREEQVEILRELGAVHVVNSQAVDFMDQLTAAIAETRATVAFDAIGGGMTAYNIIRAMENVFAPAGYQMYGSTVMKQIYAYGVLDPAPIQIARGAGMAWSVSGWLVMNHIAKLDPATVKAMHARIIRGIDTIFASHFTSEVPLDGLLDPALLQAMASRATGQKFLVTPHSVER